MRALSIDKEKKLKIINVNKPEPNGKDVVVKVSACGICGSDIHYWDIGQPEGLVMGHEYCGVVVDAGARKDLKVGDRVTALPISPCLECDACKSGNVHYCSKTWSNATGLSLTYPGAYAEYMSIRPDMVRKVPSNMEDEEVAMVEPTAVALHAVNLADIKIGSRVLIVGGGIIGVMSAELAKLQGAGYVAMTETNPARGKSAVKNGAVDAWFNPTDKKFMEKLSKASSGGFDVTIECCGNSPAVSSAIQSTKAGGTIVLVGVSLTPISIPSAIVVMQEQKVLGAIAYTEKEFDKCIELISNKRVNVKKYISKVIGLSAGQKAFESLTSGKGSDIKIILRPDKTK